MLLLALIAQECPMPHAHAPATPQPRRHHLGILALGAACGVLLTPWCATYAQLSVRVTPVVLTKAPDNQADKPAKLSPGDSVLSMCSHPSGWMALRTAWNKRHEIWAGKPDAMHLVTSATAEQSDGPVREDLMLGNPMINAKGQVVYATGKLFGGEGVWVWEAGSEPRRLGGPEDDAWLRPSGSPLIDDDGTVWTFGELAKGKSSVVRVPAGQAPETVFEFGKDKVPGVANLLARSQWGFTRSEDRQMLEARMRLDASTGAMAFWAVLSLPEQSKANEKVRQGWVATSRPQAAWVGYDEGKLRLINLRNGNRAARNPAFTGMCTARGDCFGALSSIEAVAGQPKGSARGERMSTGVGYLLAGGKGKEVLGQGDKIPGTKATFQSLERVDMNGSGMFACSVGTDQGIALLAGTKAKTHVVVAPGTTLPGTSGPVTQIRSFTVCAGGTLLFEAEYQHTTKDNSVGKSITRFWAWREGESPVMVLGPSGAPLGVRDSKNRKGSGDFADEVFVDSAMHGERRDDDVGQRQLYRVDYPAPTDGIDRRMLLVGGEIYAIEIGPPSPGTPPATKPPATK